MLTIWGRLNSINVQKVVFAARETGRPFTRIEAGMQHGIVDTPEYRAKNPNGLVPCIDDDGFVLWESNAIVRYLAARYGEGTLWPTSAQARAQSDKRMDWAAFSLYPALGPAFFHTVRLPPEKRDASLVEPSRAKTEEVLAVLEGTLATSAYVGGETFTMGDIAVVVAVHRWLNLPVARIERPGIARWYAAIAARPAAADALPPVT